MAEEQTLTLTIQKAIDLAVQHHKAGDLPKAGGIYQQILQTDPNQPIALHFLGLIAHQIGGNDRAVKLIGNALKIKPDYAEAHCNLGLTLKDLGQLDKAVTSYKNALAIEPDFALAHSNMGIALKDLGLLDEAVASYNKAIDIKPDYAEAHSNLGNALQGLGKLNEAVESFSKAIDIKPDYAEAHSNLSNVLQELGELDEAVASSSKALTIRPDYAEAHSNLGNALQGLGQLDEAVTSYNKAITIKPDYAEAHNNLGVALQGLGMVDEAIACYRKAIIIKLDYAMAHYSLGSTLLLQGDFDEGIKEIDLALSYEPGDVGWLIRRALASPVIPSSKEDLLSWRENLKKSVQDLLKKNLALDNFVSGDATTSFELSYQGLDNRLLFEEISSMYLDICPSLAWSAPHCIQSNRNLRSSSERIRIGFVSNFFHFHPVSNCFGDIIKCVSREKFEVFTISMTSSTRDNTFQDLHGHSDGTISVPNNLDKARKMIADARLDILIYPEIGMDSQTYLLAFSRLAPVQCVMSGHPDTTGIPNVDYFISNSYLEPKNADDHYSEKLIKLSSILVGDIKTHAPREDASRIDYGIPKEANVYICAQTPYKFHPEFDNILGEILRQDSEGILILFKGPVNKHSQLLYQRLSKTIPDVIDRVMLLDRVPYHEFSSILSVCDVALDTIHFNGGSTSVMAFAQGIPVVTMPTQFMRGRVTYGYYLQMGMTDCVAHTNEEYVEIAIRYARDGKLRAGMMEKIKKAYEVSLTSPQLPTLEFENFLEGTQNVSSKY